SPEARQIWAYRVPSLLGAMLAAAACAWGAAAFFGAEAGMVAGVLLAATFLLSTEAFIAKTDAALAGAITLAMAALARLYAAARGAFWSEAIGSDLAPKLAGGQETHGAIPGYHALLAPILAFPITLLLPAALVVAWRHRGEPGVRFATAWLLPTWLIFEMLPT